MVVHPWVEGFLEEVDVSEVEEAVVQGELLPSLIPPPDSQKDIRFKQERALVLMIKLRR